MPFCWGKSPAKLLSNAIQVLVFDIDYLITSVLATVILQSLIILIEVCPAFSDEKKSMVGGVKGSRYLV